METNLKCPICLEEFDLETRRARIWPTCGHTFCELCLSSYIQGQAKSKCPTDKQELKHKSNINLFPVNFALETAIQEKLPNAPPCPTHREPYIGFCVSHNRRVCAVCLEHHQGDIFKSFTTVKQDVGGHTQKMMELARDMENSCQNVNEKVDEQRADYLASIETNYEELVGILGYKKLCLKSQTNLLFDVEKNRIESMIGEDSVLYQEVSARLGSVRNVIEKDNLREGDYYTDKLQDLRGAYLFTMSQVQSQDTKREFEQMKQTFDFSLTHQKLVLFWQTGEKPEIASMLSDSRLAFEFMNSRLVIKVEHERPRKTTLELKNWLEAQEVRFIFEKDISLDEKDLDILVFIWDSLHNLSSLELKFANGRLGKDLYNVFCNPRHNLRKIEIDITNYTIDNGSLMIPFIRNILSRAEKIEKIKLIMPQLTAGEGCIGKIFAKNSFNAKNLEEFYLNLIDTPAQDSDLVNTFVSTPKLKILQLLFSGSRITDKTLVSCAQNLLSSAQNIQDLTIKARNKEITDDSIESLCKNLNSSNVRKLQLDLTKTKITDKTIGLLGETMSKLNLFKTLEAVILAFCRTKITGENLSQLLRPMPNLREFQLTLNKTSITDQTILDIAPKFSLGVLEKVTLELGIPGLSSSSLGAVLQNLSDAREIRLLVKGSSITDEPLESFIDSKSAPTSICEKLSIDASETRVSEELKDRLQLIEETGFVKQN